MVNDTIFTSIWLPSYYDAVAQAQSSFYLTYSLKEICVQLNISVALLCMPI